MMSTASRHYIRLSVTECNPVEAERKPSFRKQGGPNAWASLCRKVWNIVKFRRIHSNRYSGKGFWVELN